MTKSNAATTIRNSLRCPLPAAHARPQAPHFARTGLGCAAWDMTEIDGADDLHDADGILAAAMQRTAALYGSRRCWYLVGAARSACWRASARWHPSAVRSSWRATATKAVYHALELGQLTAHYLTPPVDAAFGIYGSVPPAAVAAALDAHPQARCVILTSPTLRGRCKRYSVHCKALPPRTACRCLSMKRTARTICRLPRSTAGRAARSRRGRPCRAECPQKRCPA